MSLVIDDPRIEALAHELARREGLTPAAAIARALETHIGAHPAADHAGRAEARAAALARLAALQARLTERGGAWPEWAELKSWGQDGRN